MIKSNTSYPFERSKFESLMDKFKSYIALASTPTFIWTHRRPLLNIWIQEFDFDFMF